MDQELTPAVAVAIATEMFLARRRKAPNPHPQYNTADAVISSLCPRYHHTKRWDRKKSRFVGVPPDPKHVARYHELADHVFNAADVAEGYTHRKLRASHWGVAPRWITHACQDPKE